MNGDDDFTSAVVARGIGGGVEHRGFTVGEQGARFVRARDVETSTYMYKHQNNDVLL